MARCEQLEPRCLLAVTAADDAFATNEDQVLQLAPRQELIPLQSLWQYLPANGDPTQLDPDFNTTWYTQHYAPGSYDGPPFLTGMGSFEYGGVDGLRATHVTDLWSNPLFPGANPLPDTVYFVIPFEFFGDPTRVTGLTAEILADDGAFLYLNGAEVGRINVGAAADTFAARAVMATNEVQFATLPLANRLQTGTNYLAVSVHNVNVQGADLGFDMRIVAQSRLGNLLDNDTSDADPPPTLRVSEVQGQPLVAGELTTPLAHGTLLVRADGTLRYTPLPNTHGRDTFTYRATDGIAVSDPATVTITINSVNDAPAVLEKTYTINEDTQLVVDAMPAPQLLVPHGATWQYLDELTNGWPEIWGGDPTPMDDYPRDAAGRLWNELTFNAATSDAAIGPWKSGATPFAQGVLDGFAGQNSTPLVGTAQSHTTDLFSTTFTLSHEQTGWERLWITFLADDGGILYINGQDVFRSMMPVGPATTNTFTNGFGLERYHSEPINAAGVLRPGVNTLAFELHQSNIDSSDRGFDLALSVSNPTSRGVLADATDVENHVLTAGLFEPARHGTVVLEPSGAFVYTPETDFYGDDMFRYVASDDGTPGSAGPPTWVTIHVLPRPDSLVAQSDRYFLDEDQTLAVHGGAISGVLANDFSNDGPLTATLTTGPLHGQLMLLPNGNFTYTPQSDFFGDDVFTYRVTDAIGDFADVPVTITVQPVNDPPVAQIQSYLAREDQPLRIALPGFSQPVITVPPDATWDFTDRVLNAQAPGGPLDYPIDSSHSQLDWNDPGFTVATSDIAWSVGVGPFVAGRINGIPSGPITALADRGVTTYLFRTSFTLAEEDAASIQYLRLVHLLDDGAALYVNGREAHRFNLPDGPLSTQTLTPAAGDENNRQTTYVEVVGLLVPRENTLAVELHDAATNDASLVEYLRISEIMYNPPDPSAAEIAAGFGDAQLFEYLELVNVSDSATLDLTGAMFVDGIDLAFGPAAPRLAPDERGVLVADEPAFRARYGDAVRVLGQYTGRLANGGETLRLNGPCAPICEGDVFNFAYHDDEPGWHPTTDGDGHSLVIVNAALELNLNDGGSWQPSAAVGGSPGAVDSIETDGRAGSDAAFDASFSVVRRGGVLVDATDVEADALSAVLIDPPAHGDVVLQPDGTFVYTPHRNFFGSDTFLFSVVDDSPLGPRASEPRTVTITVLADSDSTTCEDLDWDKSGAVDRGDLAGLASQFGAIVAPGAEGDFSGDGRVGLRDLVLLRNALGQSCGSPAAAASAPAPASAIAVRPATVDRVLGGLGTEAPATLRSSRTLGSRESVASSASPSSSRSLRARRSQSPGSSMRRPIEPL